MPKSFRTMLGFKANWPYGWRDWDSDPGVTGHIGRARDKYAWQKEVEDELYADPSFMTDQWQEAVCQETQHVPVWYDGHDGSKYGGESWDEYICGRCNLHKFVWKNS